jgi:hypothetical protein
LFFEHVWFLLQIIGQVAAPAIVLILGGLGAALAFRVRGQAAPSPLRMLLGLAGPLILVLWAGATFESPRGTGRAPWQELVHLGLTILSLVLVLGLGWSVRKDSKRWLYVPVAIGLIGLIAVAAAFGGMAISGDWI